MKKLSKIESSNTIKVHNHFAENGYIGNKKALFYLLKNYYEKQEKDVFTVIPVTFHIKRAINDT